MNAQSASTTPSSTDGRIGIAQFGLGPIGIESIKLAARQPWARIVGGVDIAPEKIGRSLADLTGLKELGDAKVYASFDELWADAQPHVVLHTAGSRADQTMQQLEPVVRRGVSVATSSEQMLFPRLAAPDETDRFDQLCQQHNARVIGTGVNPGFVLDLLPVCLTGVCRSVTGVYGEREVNASTRREPLQRKIGSGMEPEQFRERFRQGKAGHAGFKESLALIAHALGWNIGDIDETCEPMVAPSDIKTDYFNVPAGMTRGLHQRVAATADHGPTIELDLKMYLDADDPHDAIRIEGDPPVNMRIEGGVAGDHATVAALINAVPRLLNAHPGVRLMTDLAVPACAAKLKPATP